MKLNTSNKIIKTHNKVRFIGKRFSFVDKHFFFGVLSNIETVGKKNRKWLFRRLAKKRLVSNYRSLVLESLDENDFSLLNVGKLVLIDPLKFFFFRFQYPVLRSLSFFNLTDYHIELIRRMARRMFGKRVFIRVLVEAYKTLLRRTNQVRMGGGKGAKLFKKIYPLVPGSSIIEIRGYGSYHMLVNFFNALSKKFAFKMKLVLYNRI